MGKGNKKLEILKSLEENLSEPILISVRKGTKEDCLRKCDEIKEKLNNNKDLIVNFFGYLTYHDYLEIVKEERDLFSQLEEGSGGWKSLKWYKILILNKCPILTEKRLDLSNSEGLFIKSLVLELGEEKFGKELARNMLKVNPEIISRRIEAWYELSICLGNQESWKSYIGLPPAEGRNFILAYMRKCGDVYSCPYRRARYENDVEVQAYLKYCQKMGLQRGKNGLDTSM
jgi:hypothetical protein